MVSGTKIVGQNSRQLFFFSADEKAEGRIRSCLRWVRKFFCTSFDWQSIRQFYEFTLLIVTDTRTVQLLHVNPRKYKGRIMPPSRSEAGFILKESKEDLLSKAENFFIAGYPSQRFWCVMSTPIDNGLMMPRPKILVNVTVVEHANGWL